MPSVGSARSFTISTSKELHIIVSKIKEVFAKKQKNPTKPDLWAEGVSDHAMRKHGGFSKLMVMAGLQPYKGGSNGQIAAAPAQPKILVVDIEISLMKVYTFGIRDQYIGHDEIIEDWRIISWSAKWLNEKKIFYYDLRKDWKKKDDKKILKPLWNLLNEADIVVSQNGKKFDTKKIFSRFLSHGFKPPAPFRQIDTLEIAKKTFGFTSNKLDYTTHLLNKKYKKLHHGKFPGKELWIQCDKGNMKAWDEMKKYNIHDVLALEEYYLNLSAWDRSINPNVYHGLAHTVCSCGSTDFVKSKKYEYTNVSKFSLYICKKCGKPFRERKTVFDKDKRESLLK